MQTALEWILRRTGLVKRKAQTKKPSSVITEDALNPLREHPKPRSEKTLAEILSEAKTQPAPKTDQPAAPQRLPPAKKMGTPTQADELAITVTFSIETNRRPSKQADFDTARYPAGESMADREARKKQEIRAARLTASSNARRTLDIEFEYMDRDGHVTTRTVTPISYGIYLTAHCHLRRAQRTFIPESILSHITIIDTGEIVSLEEWVKDHAP